MLLELRKASKRYGDMLVIPELDLAVREGELLGVIGPNGAGKSTAFGLMAGSHACDGGQVFLDGEDVTAMRADERCRAGIGRTFQIPQPFSGMSVYENALVAATFGASLRGREASDLAQAALEDCGLLGVANHRAADLSLLQRKRLELARALATNPRLLLLDEVAGGLTDAEVGQLLALIVSIHQSGVTVVWIEHLVHALVSAADRLVVLVEGKVLSDGDPATVLSSPEVRATYLGADPDEGVDHAVR
ncbi:ABC transporter ATP-binding protein [Variovorax sp. J31P179]|uniref:ABC transporter ATP-binding protein n=1 Tax=Variovorax sp. J31P179 TaxID=3053508 RepID=UPI0025791BDC|nr:ABC transporter ATP-binding protein [Variovorax sp. J31P179]MDM0085410.1 ABC transporter ATP-binding protein [Variovorax sp. J31P179]